MLTVMAMEGYPSLRKLVVSLGPLTIITGANGSGKSSVYHVLRMLADTANGGAVHALAAEAGCRQCFGRDLEVLHRLQ